VYNPSLVERQAFQAIKSLCIQRLAEMQDGIISDVFCVADTLPDDLRDPAVSTTTFGQSLKTRLFSAYQHV